MGRFFPTSGGNMTGLTNWHGKRLENLRFLAPTHSTKELAAIFKTSTASIHAACQCNKIKISDGRNCNHLRTYRILHNGLLSNTSCRPIPEDKIIIENPISFLTRLPNECPWIHEDPKFLLCCGKETYGKTYCKDHMDVAYAERLKHC